MVKVLVMPLVAKGSEQSSVGSPQWAVGSLQFAASREWPVFGNQYSVISGRYMKTYSLLMLRPAFTHPCATAQQPLLTTHFL